MSTFSQYKPIQLNNPALFYQECAPTKQFSHLIAYYWIIKNQSSVYQKYGIIPDGSVDLIADFYGDFGLKISIGTVSYQQAHIPPLSQVWGIRFFPAAFSMAFRTPIEELVQEGRRLDFEELDHLRKHNRYLSEKLAEVVCLEEKKSVFETFLSELLHEHDICPNPHIINALHEIYSTKGDLRIMSHSCFTTCPRHLRRVFKNYIGFSPKEFSQIVRMQYVLKNMHQPDFSWYDFGFYDPSHFVHEVKKYTGSTPQMLKKHLL